MLWLCCGGAMPQHGEAAVHQIQLSVMTPTLLHVAVMESKLLPKFLVLNSMHLHVTSTT